MSLETQVPIQGLSHAALTTGFHECNQSKCLYLICWSALAAWQKPGLNVPTCQRNQRTSFCTSQSTQTSQLIVAEIAIFENTKKHVVNLCYTYIYICIPVKQSFATTFGRSTFPCCLIGAPIMPSSNLSNRFGFEDGEASFSWLHSTVQENKRQDLWFLWRCQRQDQAETLGLCFWRIWGCDWLGRGSTHLWLQLSVGHMGIFLRAKNK